MKQVWITIWHWRKSKSICYNVHCKQGLTRSDWEAIVFFLCARNFESKALKKELQYWEHGKFEDFRLDLLGRGPSCWSRLLSLHEIYQCNWRCQNTENTTSQVTAKSNRKWNKNESQLDNGENENINPSATTSAANEALQAMSEKHFFSARATKPSVTHFTFDSCFTHYWSTLPQFS